MPDQHIAALQLSANTGVKPAGQMYSGGASPLIGDHRKTQRIGTRFYSPARAERILLGLT
jgi:hypothetical protein